MPRINIGGEYEGTDNDDNPVTRHEAWVDVSQKLMDQVTAHAVEEGLTVDDALAEFIDGSAEYEPLRDDAE